MNRFVGLVPLAVAYLPQDRSGNPSYTRCSSYECTSIYRLIVDWTHRVQTPRSVCTSGRSLHHLLGERLLIPGQAKNLQFLDLSPTILDKEVVGYIVVCFTTAPEPGLVSLRLDDCALCLNALESLDEHPLVTHPTGL